MIIRVFRAKVQPGKQAEFERKVRELGIPMVKSQRGMLAYYAGRPMEANPDEFVMVTIWASLADLRAFTGENWNQPVILEEERPLIEESSVRHYEMFASSFST